MRKLLIICISIIFLYGNYNDIETDYSNQKTNILINEDFMKSFNDIKFLQYILSKINYNLNVNKGKYKILIKEEDINKYKHLLNQKNSIVNNSFIEIVSFVVQKDINSDTMIDLWIKLNKKNIIISRIIIKKESSIEYPLGEIEINYGLYNYIDDVIDYENYIKENKTYITNGKVSGIIKITSKTKVKYDNMLNEKEEEFNYIYNTIDVDLNNNQQIEENEKKGFGIIYSKYLKMINDSYFLKEAKIIFNDLWIKYDIDGIVKIKDKTKKQIINKEVKLFDFTNGSLINPEKYDILLKTNNKTFDQDIGFLDYNGLWTNNLINGDYVNILKNNNKYTLREFNGKLLTYENKEIKMEDLNNSLFYYLNDFGENKDGKEYVIKWIKEERNGLGNFLILGSFDKNSTNNYKIEDNISNTYVFDNDGAGSLLDTNLFFILGEKRIWSDNLQTMIKISKDINNTTMIKFGIPKIENQETNLKFRLHSRFKINTSMNDLESYEKEENGLNNVLLSYYQYYVDNVDLRDVNDSNRFVIPNKTIDITNTKYEWGVQTGVLIDEKVSIGNGYNLNNYYKADQNESKYYKWETGINKYNKFITIEENGNKEYYPQNKLFIYKHNKNNDDNNIDINTIDLLTYNGFMLDIPYIKKEEDFVPKYNIKDGTKIIDLNNNEYVTKTIKKEISFEETTDANIETNLNYTDVVNNFFIKNDVIIIKNKLKEIGVFPIKVPLKIINGKCINQECGE